VLQNCNPQGQARPWLRFILPSLCYIISRAGIAEDQILVIKFVIYYNYTGGLQLLCHSTKPTLCGVIIGSTCCSSQHLLLLLLFKFSFIYFRNCYKIRRPLLLTMLLKLVTNAVDTQGVVSLGLNPMQGQSLSKVCI